MAAEARLTEIAVLKTHSINYAKTREVYTAYRKAGYSKAFLEAHREEMPHSLTMRAFVRSRAKEKAGSLQQMALPSMCVSIKKMQSIRMEHRSGSCQYR